MDNFVASKVFFLTEIAILKKFKRLTEGKPTTICFFSKVAVFLSQPNQ